MRETAAFLLLVLTPVAGTILLGVLAHPACFALLILNFIIYRVWAVEGHKRFGTETVGGRKLAYNDLRQMPTSDIEHVIRQSIAESNVVSAAWAFEALLHKNGPGSAWFPIFRALDKEREDVATRFLERIIPNRQVSEESPYYPEQFLPAAGGDRRWILLIGKIYLARARKFVEKDKAGLIWHKSAALKLLNKAKATAEDAAGIALVAPFIEEALYLRYKGPAPSPRNE